MLRVSELYIYPIKSLAGIAVNAAEMTVRGFASDRRLMLVGRNNVCLTQRDCPSMALLQPSVGEAGFIVQEKNKPSHELHIPFAPSGNETDVVRIWKDTCACQVYDTYINQWFSNFLGTDCRLVYMPETTRREVDTHYAHDREITSFADAYPSLIIGQSSLDDLNARLEVKVPMNRFRPNIVFTGGKPFLEDELYEFTIGEVHFKAVKACERCVIITIDQETIERSKEPTRTLAGYRRKNNAILFGQNLLHRGSGTIRIGDVIAVQSMRPSMVFDNNVRPA